MNSESINSPLNTWQSRAAPPHTEPREPSGDRHRKNLHSINPERCLWHPVPRSWKHFFAPKTCFIMQKHAALSRSVCSITPGFWDVTPRVISLISKPQARCVSDQLSFSPAVPNLPREPLTPPVVNRMDMVLAVLVEGKALLLMTLRSHGLRAHDRSPRLCGLNCKYGSVHKHCRGIITRAAGLMWNIDAGAAVLGLNGVVLMRGGEMNSVVVALGCNNYKLDVFWGFHGNEGNNQTEQKFFSLRESSNSGSLSVTSLLHSAPSCIFTVLSGLKSSFHLPVAFCVSPRAVWTVFVWNRNAGRSCFSLVNDTERTGAGGLNVFCWLWRLQVRLSTQIWSWEGFVFAFLLL